MNRSTRTLILFMSVLVLISVLISHFYYREQNRSVDPRVVPARELYSSYNETAATGDYDAVFRLLDSIEAIYSRYRHYRNSYETGVLYNNRAAAWLTRALHDATLTENEQEAMFAAAEEAVLKSINIYSGWKERFGELDEKGIRENIRHEFTEGLDTVNEQEISDYLGHRTGELMDARKEIDRRLSVSYTNLGIIHRQKMQYDSAIQCYQRALELWDRNLTAENNINRLLGRPDKKRNIIQRLFPPEKL